MVPLDLLSTILIYLNLSSLPPRHKLVTIIGSSASPPPTPSPPPPPPQSLLSSLSQPLDSAPSQHHPFYACLVKNERVTSPSHFQDVRLISFDVTGSGIRLAFPQCMPLSVTAAASVQLLPSPQVQGWRCAHDPATEHARASEPVSLSTLS